jgi:hypothetical protein
MVAIFTAVITAAVTIFGTWATVIHSQKAKIEGAEGEAKKAQEKKETAETEASHLRQKVDSFEKTLADMREQLRTAINVAPSVENEALKKRIAELEKVKTPAANPPAKPAEVPKIDRALIPYYKYRLKQMDPGSLRFTVRSALEFPQNSLKIAVVKGYPVAAEFNEIYQINRRIAWIVVASSLPVPVAVGSQFTYQSFQVDAVPGKGQEFTPSYPTDSEYHQAPVEPRDILNCGSISFVLPGDPVMTAGELGPAGAAESRARRRAEALIKDLQGSNSTVEDLVVLLGDLFLVELVPRS